MVGRIHRNYYSPTERVTNINKVEFPYTRDDWLYMHAPNGWKQRVKCFSVPYGTLSPPSCSNASARIKASCADPSYPASTYVNSMSKPTGASTFCAVVPLRPLNTAFIRNNIEKDNTNRRSSIHEIYMHIRRGYPTNYNISTYIPSGNQPIWNPPNTSSNKEQALTDLERTRIIKVVSSK
jgi:hypothetical protein